MIQTSFKTVCVYLTLFCLVFLVGALGCQDKSKCPNYRDCTDKDAERRAGYTCAKFPYYNGGVLGSPPWRYDTEFYHCDHRQTATGTCLAWRMREETTTFLRVALGECTVVNDGFCSTIKVSENTVQKCKKEPLASVPEFSLVDGTRIKSKCCDCGNADCCLSRAVDVGLSDFLCHCTQNATVPDTNDIVCDAWACEDTRAFYYTREFYECVQVGVDGYCTHWEGEHDVEKEFSVLRCACEDASCDTWTCSRKTLGYHIPNAGFYFYGAFLGTLGICLLCFGCYMWLETRTAIYICLTSGFFTMLALVVVPTLIFGGFAALISTAVVCFVVWGIFDVNVYILKKKKPVNTASQHVVALVRYGLRRYAQSPKTQPQPNTEKTNIPDLMEDEDVSL